MDVHQDAVRKQKNLRNQLRNVSFAVSSQSHRKKLAWKFVKLLCCDKKVQQYLLRHSQGSTVLRSVISSRQTKRFLEEDGITHNALMTESLDAILNSMRASQHFKNTMTQWDGQII